MNDLTVHSPLQVNGFDQAMRLAEVMASGKLVPTHLQKSASDCLMVVEQAMRWGMSPFAVAQSTSVIQGKLMYEGKLVAAVINSRGDLEEKLSYEYKGEGDSRAIIVSGRVRGEEAARTVGVAIKDARTSNKVWQTQPDQQLMYHGARVWARRHMPELMLGVYVPEEMPAETMRDITPEKPKRVTADPLAGSASDMAARVVGMQPLTTAANPPAEPPQEAPRANPSEPVGASTLDLPFIHGNVTKSCTSRPAFLGMMEAVFISGTDPDDMLECFFANQPTLNDLQSYALGLVDSAKTEKAKTAAQAYFDRIKALFDQAHALRKAQSEPVA